MIENFNRTAALKQTKPKWIGDYAVGGVLFSVASGLCFIRLDAVVSATVRPGGTGIATPTACAPAALRLGHLQTQAPVTDVKPLERREGMLGVLDCPEVEEREAGLAAPDDAEGLDITVADLRLELTHAHPPEVKPYHTVYLIRLEAIGWLGSRVVSMLDSGAEGLGFKSQPRRCRVTVLGKLFTPIVFTKQKNW